MTLKMRRVSHRDNNYKKICDTMIEAFPKSERVPLWLLLLLAKRKLTNFSAVYDNEEYLGVLYSVENEHYVFILYFAVDKAVRSKGYGSQILEFVKQKFKGKNIVLDAEYPDPESLNIPQRLKRMSFYAKNGIFDTGYFFGKKKDKYAVLSSVGSNVDIGSYTSLLKYLSFGLYAPKIHKKV